MCYRDMTFCPFYKDCAKQSDCHRPYTPEVAELAEVHGMPVCLYVNKPGCWEAQEEGKEKAI